MNDGHAHIPTEKIELIPAETPQRSAPRRAPTPKIVGIGAIAITVAAALSAVFPKSSSEPAQPTAPPVTLSKPETLRSLVNRGLVPRQALDPAPTLTEREKFQWLVDRGLVSCQAMDPAMPRDSST